MPAIFYWHLGFVGFFGKLSVVILSTTDAKLYIIINRV